MATLPTYDRNPQASQFGQTAKIGTGGSPVAQALGQLGGQIGQIGAQFKQKQDRLQDMGAVSDYNVATMSAFDNAETLWNQAQQSPDTQMRIEDKPQFIKEELDRFRADYVSKIEASDAVKMQIGNDFQERVAEYDIGLNKEVNLKVAERNVVKIEGEISALVAAGDYEAAQKRTAMLSEFATQEKADAFLASAMKDANERSINQSILLNPARTVDYLRSGEWDLSAEDRIKYITIAETQRNKVQVRNGDALKGRLLGLIYDKPVVDGDSFQALERDTVDAFEAGTLSNEAFESNMKKLENPFGKTEKMLPEDMSVLMTEIGQYDPGQDPTRRNLAELWSKVSSVEDQRGYEQLKQLYEIVEKGGVTSIHWNDINGLIQSDLRRDMFGRSVVSAQTGLFAQQEVAAYLRENQTDREGALKLYEEIKANDVQEFTKDFYRDKYSYGSGSTMVGMIAPDGRVLRVPQSKVAELEAKGAIRQ